MKKRILVTGAAGFIGCHLARFLHKRGDYVVGYDNFNDYYSPQLKESRAKQLQDLGIEVHLGDICNEKLLNDVVEKHEITHIAHLAAQPGVRYSLINPQAYVKSNIEGFLNILELCRNRPTIKLTYASSSSVYGLNDKTPFSESDRTDNQASLYGATKKSNEQFASTYHHLFGISVTGLRYFTVYGPWGRPDMAYYSFVEAILEGRPIEVYNHGKLKRDFTYIDDIIDGTVAAIDLEADCEVFNLGNHRPVKLMDFLRIVEDSVGKKAKMEFLPMQPGDVFETYADIAHSQEKLGFFPKTTLEEGIPKFVEWYKQYL
ncbi:MAG: UDP-N-acetylglucosamine 4-epimerase [Chlamydiae bacterium]|nr:UDP-N-acetylglucosamine 4-epimerase [Chlamydiota bacterium]